MPEWGDRGLGTGVWSAPGRHQDAEPQSGTYGGWRAGPDAATGRWRSWIRQQSQPGQTGSEGDLQRPLPERPVGSEETDESVLGCVLAATAFADGSADLNIQEQLLGSTVEEQGLHESEPGGGLVG